MRPQAAGAALAVLFLVNVLNFYDRQALGAIVEPLRHEFHLTDTQLGAIPTVFTILYAIVGLPIGRMVDRRSRKGLLAVGVAVWAGLTGLGGLSMNYATLFLTRMGVGVGEAVCAPAATSWIGDLVPAAKRARALAFFMVAVPIGSMLSFAISGPVAQAWGWRLALAAAAAPAMLLVPALLRLPEPERSPSMRKESASPMALARIPAMWWIAASGALVNFILYSFSTFIAAFLTRFHGLSVAQAGLWAGAGTGVAGIAGAAAAGYLGDRTNRLRLAASAALLSAPFGVAAIWLPRGSTAAAIVLMMVAYGLWQVYYGPVYAAIQDIVPAGLRGTAMAAYFLVMYLAGGSMGPVVTGRLSDHFARQAAAAGASAEAARAAGLHDAMYVLPLCSVGLAIVLWMANRAASRSSAASA